MKKQLPIDRFMQFCKSEKAKNPELEELDWYALSIGFFLALGMSVTEAITLAIKVRYTFHYWQ